MKPTQTPAYRPTAASIWNSFLNSGKRHLILTGRRGAGKTTLMRQLCADMPGLVTYAVAENGVYITEYPHGEKALIGEYDPSLPGFENKMRICRTGFEAHAVPMAERLCEKKANGSLWMKSAIWSPEASLTETRLKSCFAKSV